MVWSLSRLRELPFGRFSLGCLLWLVLRCRRCIVWLRRACL
nr:MAG TPA: hypothetical protein [Caudoviricetes sp.]